MVAVELALVRVEVAKASTSFPAALTEGVTQGASDATCSRLESNPGPAGVTATVTGR